MKTVELNDILKTKKRIETPFDEMEALKSITKSAIQQLVDFLGLNKKEMIALLPVSPKTIERLEAGIIADRVIAEHLLHIAKVAKEGTEVFESPQQLSKWLKTPHPIINNLEPYEILRTVTGCGIIVDLLGQTKHGIPS